MWDADESSSQPHHLFKSGSNTFAEIPISWKTEAYDEDEADVTLTLKIIRTLGADGEDDMLDAQSVEVYTVGGT